MIKNSKKLNSKKYFKKTLETSVLFFEILFLEAKNKICSWVTLELLAGEVLSFFQKNTAILFGFLQLVNRCFVLIACRCSIYRHVFVYWICVGFRVVG